MFKLLKPSWWARLAGAPKWVGIIIMAVVLVIILKKFWPQIIEDYVKPMVAQVPGVGEKINSII